MAEPTQVQDKPLFKLDAAATPSVPVPDSQAVKDELDQLHKDKSNDKDNGQDSDSGDDDEADGVNGAGGDSNGVAKKKKKKKPKKKKNAASKGAGAAAGGPAMKQTDPPSIGLSKLYPSGQYPVGEVSEYTGE